MKAVKVMAFVDECGQLALYRPLIHISSVEAALLQIPPSPP
jgi:hypothetical protein